MIQKGTGPERPLGKALRQSSGQAQAQVPPKPAPKGIQLELMEQPHTVVQTPNILRCKCEGCHALRTEYTNDHQLLKFYAKKLLIRGWAGKLSDTEKLYLLNHAEWFKSAVESGRRTAARNFSNVHANGANPRFDGA